MTVRLLQAMAGADGSWGVGELYQVADADEAGRLIEAGIAEAASAAPLEVATAPEPKKRSK